MQDIYRIRPIVPTISKEMFFVFVIVIFVHVQSTKTELQNVVHATPDPKMNVTTSRNPKTVKLLKASLIGTAILSKERVISNDRFSWSKTGRKLVLTGDNNVQTGFLLWIKCSR